MFGFDESGHLGDRLRRRRGARASAPTTRRSSAGCELGRGARADRRMPALGELLAGRARRARAGPARSSTSTAASSAARPTISPAARTSASWSTGTSSSCSTTSGPRPTARGIGARAAARQQHRHRARPQPHGGDPAGQGLGVRDRPVPAADRARRGALARAATARTSRPTARCASSPTTRAR